MKKKTKKIVQEKVQEQEQCGLLDSIGAGNEQVINDAWSVIFGNNKQN